MKLFKKNSKGLTRIILVITVFFLILWSCCALEAQINREVFVQAVPDGYTVAFEHCFSLLFIYGLCFIPMIIYWIIDGFRKDKNDKFM